MRISTLATLSLFCMLVAACGDDDSHSATPDAGRPDAGPAANPDGGEPAVSACQTLLDCTSASAPTCGEEGLCVAGPTCEDDDEGEPGDDGPAGATAIASPTASAATTVTGETCNTDGATEYDFYKVELDGSQAYTARVVSGDVAVGFLTANGRGSELGFPAAYSQYPQRTHLPRFGAGTYYLYVTGIGPSRNAATPYEIAFELAECSDTFDCSAGQPSCDLGQCVSFDSCTDDDAGEPANDGPVGATDITPAVGASVTVTAAICDAPRDELDWHRVTVADADSLDIELAWQGNADLDLVVTNGRESWAIGDPDGTTYGFSFKRQPEVVRLTNLPAGDYYLAVARSVLSLDPAYEPSAESVPYSLTVSRETSQGCRSVADCDDEFTTQWFRGDCNASTGACEFIDGKNSLPTGSVCDSEDEDCAAGAFCILFEFGANAADNWFCTELGCQTDADCQAIKPGSSCVSDPEEPSVTGCVQRCQTDLDCGWYGPGADPDPSLPWKYLVCNQSTGLCDAPELEDLMSPLPTAAAPRRL